MMALPAGGVFGRNNHLVPVLPGGKPFTQPDLGLLFSVCVGGVDEVPALTDEIVEDLKGGILATFSVSLFARSAEGHGT